MSDGLIEFKERIGNVEYSTWGYLNALIAKNITKQYEGYKLFGEIDNNVTAIYWQSDLHPEQGKKYIGRVVYNIPSDTLVYMKQGFNQVLHEFHKDNSIGLCWDVICQLRPKDYVRIEELTKRPKGKNVYTISVNKLLENKSFRYFKKEGFEKQIFVPKEEFKQEWEKVTTKRRRKK